MSEKQHKTYVMKFGGSSLAGSKQILQSATLVKKYAADSNLVVVCSAMGDTTDHLLKAIDHAKKGETNQARKVISEVHVSHMAAVNESITEGKYKEICRDLLTELFDEIDKVLLGISLLKDLSPRSLDYVLSFGERLATNIMSNVLAGMGLKTRYLSGGEAGILTDESFGSAEPILSVTNEKLRSKLFPL
ncbi:MAG: aspartate kinase, partial [Nitrososphaerota archaeon]|nr:aspartate kinase [Nitrososphaerota archaeon]